MNQIQKRNTIHCQTTTIAGSSILFNHRVTILMLKYRSLMLIKIGWTYTKSLIIYMISVMTQRRIRDQNGLNNPPSLSEVKSFYESIIVLDNIKENNPRYVEFTANNLGNPFIMESSVSNNEENHDGQHPVLLSDTGLGDEPKVEQATTSLNSLNSLSNFHIQGWI